MNCLNEPIHWNEAFLMLHNTERKEVLGELSIHRISIKASVLVKWIGQDESWCSWHVAVDLNCLKQLFTAWIHLWRANLKEVLLFRKWAFLFCEKRNYPLWSWWQTVIKRSWDKASCSHWTGLSRQKEREFDCGQTWITMEVNEANFWRI